MGIIEKGSVDYNITLDLDPDDIGKYVDGDYVYRRYKKKVTSPAGQEYERTVEVTMFGMVLAGDTWDLYYNDSNDWQSSLSYHVDDENEKVIRSILFQYAMRENDEITMEDLNEMDTESLIEEYDDNYYVRSAINNATSNAEASDYSDYLYGLLKDALQEYGTIEKMDDSGVILHVNVEPYFNEISDDYLDEYMERCDDDIKCVFEEMASEGDIDKPKWDPDDRWYPSVDNSNFNEMLSDYLHDAARDYGIN